ncbi:MAG: hypothetical protein K6G18_17055 [Treponema sp.]|nr:hypothetical protein [Treponema sp.]
MKAHAARLIPAIPLILPFHKSGWRMLAPLSNSKMSSMSDCVAGSNRSRLQKAHAAVRSSFVRFVLSSFSMSLKYRYTCGGYRSVYGVFYPRRRLVEINADLAFCH